ncbi:MAG: peptidylprolyl isomerase [Dysgonamonadaceae bacterium]|nr:peptidylprolyl isomerase [Dysgonamonadaceae bacterium]
MKKFPFLVFLLSCFVFPGEMQSQDNVIDEVIWMVGDEPILRSEVENARLQMQIYNQRIQGDPYCVIPEQIAIQKLYLHQANLDSIVVPEDRLFQLVESRLNMIINQIGSREKVEEYRGKTLNAIREEMREDIKDQMMIESVQQKLVDNIKVTPAEIRSFYNRIPQDSLPFIPANVEVEIITQEPVISLNEIDHIKNRLREFTEQVNSGERDFSTLARLYSEDMESAKKGGELGFRGKATLVPEFSAAAFEMNDPSKISRIVESEYGFHIIQLIEKRGDRINARHILLRPKVSSEELKETVLRMDSIRNDIIEGKFSFEEGATYVSHDKDTRNNRGLMVNQNEQTYSERTGTSRFEMGELPPEIGKVIYEMKEGEISKPFTMTNSKQKEVVAIVRLKSRTEGHRAGLSDDYQTLRAMVEEEKKNQALEKWLSEKIKDTYIRINDNWKNCDFRINTWLSE